ncbi:MAG: murein hydrolase activator EnvC family protein [Polaribacter sp.]
MTKVKLYSLFFVFFFIGFSAFSQSRKQLEIKQKELKLEIKKVNYLLFYAKKDEKNALENLKDINQKINVRTRLIETINLQAKLLSKEIKTNQRKLRTLNKKLADLKADYADMIFKSYKSKSQQSKAMFLLSSQNFYQAYKRLEYIKQYTSYRKKQGKKIVLQKEIVKKLNDSLVLKKREKDKLILVEKEENKKIQADKKKQERLISTIKKKEKKYKRQLKKKLRAEKKIAERIDKIIRKAITTSNKKVRTTSVSKSKKKNEFILSPEAKALAAKFELNKGKLPWPVTEGLIVRKFGVQAHPTIGGITINSTGLHIVTKKGMNAACIFNGKVLAIQSTSEGRKNVLVQHGNYITAYNNLEKTFVKVGNNVVTGQKIGQIFTDKVTGKTTLIFVLFKNTKRLNPSSWILKG